MFECFYQRNRNFRIETNRFVISEITICRPDIEIVLISSRYDAIAFSSVINLHPIATTVRSHTIYSLQLLLYSSGLYGLLRR